MEDGTYRRDQFIAKVHERERQEKSSLDKSNQEPQKNTKPSAKVLSISEKEKKAIDTLYKKLIESSGPSGKVPDRAAFADKLEKQMLHFKEKNPGKPMALKLTKDERGKIQIKLSSKDKA
jgi:hypothetical protein